MAKRSYYISTSIPYVNAAPHIGHALEFVQADVLARYHRRRGDDVFFLTGTDENSLKNVIAAETAKVQVKDWVERLAKVFKNLAQKLSISNNDFIRTSAEKRHIDGAKKLWNACRPEDIYKKKYKGLYCIGCEEFKTMKDLQGGRCEEHPNQDIQEVEEENYFFRLSAYQDRLEKLIADDALLIVPESRKNEILSFIRGGLEDFSISRSRERAKDWGVPVPGDQNQIMYVWVDALSNYITALDYADNGEKYQKYWVGGDNICHLIGKNITRFHAVYWPAILLSAGVRLPQTLFVHGFFTINGQKISKSLGNVIDPFDLIEKYGTDALRYYLLSEIPSHEDGDFSIEKFEARYNGNLANGLGNYAARVLTLAHNANIANWNANVANEEIQEKIKGTRKTVSEKIDDFKLHEALSTIWELISFGDKYINENKPWAKSVEDGSPEQASEARFREITIYNALYILENVAELLKPFLPETADKVLRAIQHSGKNIEVNKLPPLFPRLQ
ncbi:MAG: methionine--tRNA ligase [Candidatus Liptonbacteria bacterium]|nr:methionine--tRNA ligase [Candidatus Liptonbacteria bacterium]